MTNHYLKKPSDAPIVQGSKLIGTMKGTITSRRDGKVFNFHTDEVFRSTTEAGKFQVFGRMRHPDTDIPIRIEFQLANKDAPSGNYIVGTPAVSVLSLIYPFSPAYSFEALSGVITLQNHFPEVRINGLLKFLTEAKFGDQYDVEVTFDVTGIN